MQERSLAQQLAGLANSRGCLHSNFNLISWCLQSIKYDMNISISLLEKLTTSGPRRGDGVLSSPGNPIVKLQRETMIFFHISEFLMAWISYLRYLIFKKTDHKTDSI